MHIIPDHYECERFWKLSVILNCVFVNFQFHDLKYAIQKAAKMDDGKN